MKYALISEEQIKQIEDALDELEYSSSTMQARDKYAYAIAIIQSLKPQEPIGYKNKTSIVMSWHETKLFNIPLYALEQL